MTATALRGRPTGAGRVVNSAWFLAALAESGLSQAEFARLAGLSASTVWKAANHRPLGPKTIRHLYQALRDLPPLPHEVLQRREHEQVPLVKADLNGGYMDSLAAEGPAWET